MVAGEVEAGTDTKSDLNVMGTEGQVAGGALRALVRPWPSFAKYASCCERMQDAVKIGESF